MARPELKTVGQDEDLDGDVNGAVVVKKTLPLVSELIAGHRDIDVPIRADAQDENSEVLGIISVTYNPRNMTPAVERSFLDMQRAKGAGAAGAAAKLILATVKSWDLQNNYPALDANGDPEVDDDGRVVWETRTVPLTEDALADLSIQILAPIMMAIVNDMNPKTRSRNGRG